MDFLKAKGFACFSEYVNFAAKNLLSRCLTCVLLSVVFSIICSIFQQFGGVFFFKSHLTDLIDF